MTTDDVTAPASPGGPVLGAGLPRAALAGLLAEVLFVVLMAGTALVTRVLLPGCTGDSCIGSPRSWAAVLLSPFVLLGALLLAVRVLRLARPGVTAGVAWPVAVLLLGAAAAAGLGLLQYAGPAVPVLVLLGVLVGPVAVVCGAAVATGHGPGRFVPAAVAVVLVVGVVAASVVLAPFARARAVTAAVPQPYGYVDPDLELNSLNLNGYTHGLELGYVPSDPLNHPESVELREFGPLSAADRAAPCLPKVAVGEPEDLCRRLPSPSPGVTVWRSASTASLPYVAVAFPDATVIVFATSNPDDAAAAAVVARLRPASARSLLDAAPFVSV